MVCFSMLNTKIIFNKFSNYRCDAAYSDEADPGTKHDTNVEDEISGGLSAFGKVRL